MNNAILLVDDDADIRHALRQTLELAGYDVTVAASADEALHVITHPWLGAVISDVRMPGDSGLDLLDTLVSVDATLPIVMLSGHGDIAMALSAIRRGAYDFLEKPCASETLLDVMRRAMEKRNLVLENQRLRMALDQQPSSIDDLIEGQSPTVQHYREQLIQVASLDSDVLISGETGSGKDLAAQVIHRFSSRNDKPFVAVNSGAITGDIADWLLSANTGVLFLDEIESMPEAVQIQLLRVLEERVISVPVTAGQVSVTPLDIRVLAATKTYLPDLVGQGRFRADLYYRLDIVRVAVPALRERRQDIGVLFHEFVSNAAQRLSLASPDVPGEVTNGLHMHTWPGNVRELKATAERYALNPALGVTPSVIHTDSAAQKPDHQLSLREQVDSFENAVISAALREYQGHIGDVCEALGIPRRTLHDKLKRYALVPDDFR